MSAPILAPAAMLVLWSMVVLLWVMFTRFPAFKQAGVDLRASPPGGRYQDIQDAMPDRVNWKSHNYLLSSLCLLVLVLVLAVNAVRITVF
ncbi:MAG: hypothetical protein ACJAYC_000448 [Halieaceae bacterium]|jgi:hypothetical protein